MIIYDPLIKNFIHPGIVRVRVFHVNSSPETWLRLGLSTGIDYEELCDYKLILIDLTIYLILFYNFIKNLDNT